MAGQSTRQTDRGFTLIELIVVMVIIGVLAMIALPIYQKQQRQAVDASLKVDVKKFGDSVSTWFVDYSSLPLIYMVGNGSNGGQRLGALQPDGRVFEFLQMSPGTRWNNSGPGWFRSRYDWCLSLNNDRGEQKMFNYRPGRGVSPGRC